MRMDRTTRNAIMGIIDEKAAPRLAALRLEVDEREKDEIAARDASVSGFREDLGKELAAFAARVDALLKHHGLKFSKWSSYSDDSYNLASLFNDRGEVTVKSVTNLCDKVELDSSVAQELRVKAQTKLNELNKRIDKVKTDTILRMALCGDYKSVMEHLDGIQF